MDLDPIKSNETTVTDVKVKNAIIDKLGVWVSALCAIHCLLFPLLLPLVPVLAASIFVEEWFEVAMIALSIAIGFTAFLIGFFQYHRQLYPIYLLLLAGVVFWQKEAVGEGFEPIIVTLGAAFLIAAHLLNIRLCKRCINC